uniref:Uncharacterized protein n=1 Tax=Arundo donax TaxID=35708 RepID=A0A0A8Y9N1_ARUDO
MLVLFLGGAAGIGIHAALGF